MKFEGLEIRFSMNNEEFRALLKLLEGLVQSEMREAGLSDEQIETIERMQTTMHASRP